MAATAYDDNDGYTMILSTILKICKNGCKKDNIIQETQLSHDQLRRITAEMADRELLHYIEGQNEYITTDKGYIFLNERKQQKKRKKKKQSNALQTNSKVANDNKIKTKQESLNSIASKQNIIHRKIQLWTNRYQNEFAIRVTGDSSISIHDDDNDDDSSNTFLASTNPKEDYITVVGETDYFEDLKHGWEYTLSHLIEQYKHEIRSVSLRTAHRNKANNKSQEEEGFNTSNNDKSFSIRLIPYIKCEYCNTEFVSENEKKEHELEWHV
jgi:predicted transcriptional regulator